jgi:hypothetical protein
MRPTTDALHHPVAVGGIPGPDAVPDAGADADTEPDSEAPSLMSALTRRWDDCEEPLLLLPLSHSAKCLKLEMNANKSAFEMLHNCTQQQCH